MARKIFVSYKYADSNVAQFSRHNWLFPTTVRDYVNLLESYIDSTNHIYKGEHDQEDLSMLSEDKIWEILKGKIYDSTVTIIMISPNMKEKYKSDKNQWIPWEVAFSLKETTRNDRTSHSNAMLAIVLPDRNNSYNYYFGQSDCGAIVHHIDRFFKIIEGNRFNWKSFDKYFCFKCRSYRYNYKHECSYIEAIKWIDFIVNPNIYIERAVKRQEHKDKFNIQKEI